MSSPLRIDAHHHVWDLSIRDQPWTAELPVLRRTFEVEELLGELAASDVDGTVVVQTVATTEETPELLSLATKHREVVGVVGWVDLTAPDVAERIDALVTGPDGGWLVGIRHQVQEEPDPQWLLREDVVRGLRAVAAAGLVYDFVVTHDQLADVVRVVDRVPGMLWALDHAGKPPIATRELEPWRAHLAALAAHEGVACKLSGLVTEAGPSWSPAQLMPYADHVLAEFGPHRVMFGSDWPVCLLRTTYAGSVSLTQGFLAGLDEDAQAQVWGGTAQRWYGLTSPGSGVAGRS